MTRKLCTDCVHRVGSGDFMLCSHPKVPPSNLATGTFQYASTARMEFIGLCGPNAKFHSSQTAQATSGPPPMPLEKLYPELEPLPAAYRRKVSWWDRFWLRVAKWVRS